MKMVFLVSPEGDAEFARACIQDCLSRDEAPFAPHVFYGVEPSRGVDDLGSWAGQVYLVNTSKVVSYIDNGTTDWMQDQINQGAEWGVTVEERKLTNKT
jgi:hypothetical protein